MNKQYNRESKIKEGNPRENGPYARRIGASIGRLDRREHRKIGTDKNKTNTHDPRRMEATSRDDSNPKKIKCLHNAGTYRGD